MQYLSDSRNKSIPGVLLCALFCLLYLVVLGVRPLFIPDEVRYGEIAREMIVLGDWIVPRLNGLPYFEKPPFGHWMNAISLTLFGENPFAVRFASAASAGVSALTVFYLGRTLFASRAIPYLAAFIFLTTFEVQAIGTYSVLDSTFAAALNAGIAIFAIGSMSTGRRRKSYLAISGVFFGVAFLTKGFLAFALPFLVLVPWLVMHRRFELLFRQAWISVLLALIVIAPWAVAIHLQQPDFWHYFFWVEHIQRFAADNAQHKEPFYYFLMYLPVLAFPWIALLPVAIGGLKNRSGSNDIRGTISLLVLWTLLPFLFFSIASGKLATYVLPCMLPLSLILAAGLSEAMDRAQAFRAANAFVGTVFFAALAALLFVYVRPPAEPVFTDFETAKFMALSGALVLALLILIHGLMTSSSNWRALSSGMAMIPVLVALPYSIPELATTHKAPVTFLEEAYAGVPTDTIVVTNGSLVRAVSWSLKREDIYVVDGGGETTYGLQTAEGKGRFLSTDEFGNLINSGKGVLLMCKERCKPDTRSRLPSDFEHSSYGNFNAYFVPARAASQGDPDSKSN